MKSFLSILLILVCCVVKGQQISGVIIDEDKRACPNCYVTLTGSDSLSVVTCVADSLGHYFFEEIKQGRYELCVKCIGYNTSHTTINVQDSDCVIPPVVLTKNTYILDGVVIKGSSFIRHDDRILITPDNLQKKHASTGYDLLYNLMIPGLEVDSRNGTVSNGINTASLYINGQKAEYIEIKGLRPKDIKQVEYIDLPHGKYATEKLVINFITKKQETGGYVSVDGSQNVGYTRGDYNIVAKIRQKNTSYTLFGGYSNDIHTNHAVKTEMMALGKGNVNRETNTTKRYKNNKQYLQLNIDNQTEKRALSAKIGFVRTSSPDNYSIDDISYNHEAVISAYNQNNSKGIMPTVSLYGNFDINDSQSFDISIKGNYARNKYNKCYDEGQYFFKTNASENIYNIDCEANYNVKLKHNNALGVKLSHLRQISMTNYSGSYTAWSHLWTGETLVTGEYSQNFGDNISAYIQIGADVLTYRQHGDEKQNFVSPYYNFMLNYSLGKGQNLYVSLNRGNSNPDISYLSRVEQVIDSLQIQRGNPVLDKANYYMATINYGLYKRKFNLSATAFWFGAIPSIGTDYYAEGNKLIHSLMSDYNYNQVKFTLAVTYKATSQLHLTARSICTYYDRSGKFSATQTEFDGFLGINYYVKDFAFKAFGKTVNRVLGIDNQSRQSPASYGVTASWNHNNWSVELGGSNFFTHHSETSLKLVSDVYFYKTYNYNDTEHSSGYIKIGYTLDFGKKTSRAKKDIDTTINSAILKAE